MRKIASSFAAATMSVVALLLQPLFVAEQAHARMRRRNVTAYPGGGAVWPRVTTTVARSTGSVLATPHWAKHWKITTAYRFRAARPDIYFFRTDIHTIYDTVALPFPSFALLRKRISLRLALRLASALGRAAGSNRSAAAAATTSPGSFGCYCRGHRVRALGCALRLHTGASSALLLLLMLDCPLQAGELAR